jgi:integrase
MSIQKRGETWYADITIPGRERFRGSLGTADKATAQRLHDELRAKLHQREAAGHTWYEAVAEWLKLGERSDPERRILLAYDPGDVPLSEITSDSFKIGHHKPATYRRYVNVFRSILRHAQAKGWVDKVPTFPEKKQPPSRLRWITHEEWGRLYLQLPEHLKAPALFAISTGLRQANVLGMEWSRVDFERKVTWFSADEMKNKRHHGIPLSDTAIEALEMAKGQHERWCFTYRKNRIGKIKRAWTEAVKRSGITDFTWHDLRHTWASWHVQNGTPLDRLQKLGGWEGIEMVLKYSHLAPEHLEQFANNSSHKIVHKGPTPP